MAFTAFRKEAKLRKPPGYEPVFYRLYSAFGMDFFRKALFYGRET
jgi:hypothetical protein